MNRTCLLQLPSLFSGVCKSDARLDNKVAVITGCNAGIGKITALEFCKRGARVIMACRDLERAGKAADDIRKEVATFPNAGEILVKKLDLASFKSVRECARNILASEKRVHILVNNAGIFCPWELTEDGYEMQFQTNYLGHFLFTLLLMPSIINAAPARIINLTSLLYTLAGDELHLDDATIRKPCPALHSYAKSKLALILFSKELACRLKDHGVMTYSVHPGYVHTDVFRNYGIVFHPITQWFMQSSLGKILVHKSPEQGAQTTLYCALAEEADKESGLYYSDCKPIRPVKSALNSEKGKELWNFSWCAVKLPQDYNPFVGIETTSNCVMDDSKITNFTIKKP